MKTPHEFNSGDSVTWGSGAIRALVLRPASQDSYSVTLAADYPSPCGRVWTKGTVVEMPAEELRLLA